MKKTTCYLGITLAILCFGFTSNAQIIFKETFDNISGPTAGGAGTYSFPNGWFLRNVDNRTPAANVGYVNEAWERREDFQSNVLDSVAFSTSWYTPIGAADDWMWTPMIPTLPANCVLKWEAKAYDPLYPDGYEVRIMTSAGGPTGGTGVIGNQVTNSTVLFSIPAEQTGSRASRVVSLAAYAGQSVYIGFRNNSTDKFILIIDNIIVEQGPGPLVTAAAQTNVSCNGGSNGSAGVSVSGGTPGYTYSWSPSGGTAATATGLSAGTYTCTVTDANGSIGTQTFTITQPALLTVSTSQTNISCNGGSNGSAGVSVSGGTPGYTYSWSPSGGTGATATGLTAGTYTCTIEDANSCIATKSITITQPAVMAITTSQTNVSCNGGSNGTASVSATGGTPAYTYSWSPTGGTAATASGLSAGTYTCTVTDANGCTATRNFTITQPSAVSGSAVVTNVSCNGGNNGTINLTPSGGTAPYTYNWGGGIATQDRTGLVAGTYSVTITDANGCTATRNFTLTQPPAVAVSSVNVPANGTYTGGDNLSFTINFNQNVIVNTAGGIPYIPLTLNTGGTVQATYVSGSGSSALVFLYTITSTNQDADGISLGSSIVLNGGTLQNSGGCAALPGINGLPSTTGVLVHNPVSQTITFNTLPNKTYGDADFDANATASSGLTVSYTSSNTAVATIVAGKIHIAGAGSSVITATQTGNSNYLAATAVSQTLTVNPKAIAVTADAKTKTYGDADPAFTYTASPALVSGDVFTGELSRTAGEDVGAYAINQNTLALSSNYAITYTSADLTINKKAVTVTADAKTKIYGDADPALTYSVSPALISGDAFSGELSRAAGESVGAYAITQNTLALNGNYTITYTSADLTISKKAVMVTADAKVKIYGDADPAFTYTVSPALVNGDAFSGELSRTAGEDVGTYPITQGSLANGNYDISFVNGVLTIDKAAQLITWNQTLIAGCDGSTNIVLTATASSGLTVNYQSANAAIATINGNQLLIAGPGKTIITATQAGNNNYLPATLVQSELTSKLPAYLVVKRWDDVLVFDNSSKQYTTWQWYKNNGPINGATGQYYYESSKLNGDYYAIVKTVAGTSLQTCPVTITPGSTFIPIAIFPNPVDPGQSITVKTSYTATQLQGATIVVSNIQGVIVQTIQNVMPQTNITMPVVQGFYVIRLKLSDGTTASVNALVKPQ